MKRVWLAGTSILFLTTLADFRSEPKINAHPRVDVTAIDEQVVTVRGDCVDSAGKQLEGATIRVFRRFADRRAPQLLRTVNTGLNGEFDLGGVTLGEIEPNDGADGIIAFASKDGLATVEVPLPAFRRKDAGRNDGCLIGNVRLPPAATLRGTVRDAAGQPVPNARLFTTSEYIEGIHSAVTDESGQYAISDVPEVKATYFQELGVLKPMSRLVLRLSHHELGDSSHWYWETDRATDIQLTNPTVISGRVVNKLGQPMADLAVCSQRATSPRWEAPPADSVVATTDIHGKFTLRLQGEGVANVFLADSRHVAVAVENVAIKPGTVVNLDDICLSDGGRISGVVFDAASNRPIRLTSGEQLWIMAHSPARPRSGAAVHGVRVRSDGSFELQVPAGTCWPYFGGGSSMSGKTYKVVKGPSAEQNQQKPLKIDERGVVRLNFTVSLQ